MNVTSSAVKDIAVTTAWDPGAVGKATRVAWITYVKDCLSHEVERSLGYYYSLFKLLGMPSTLT